jgi:hypothetical protein
MIEQLFGSKTRVKLLQLFYSNPNRSFYVREITRKIDEQINSVRRELSNLLNIGIIVSDSNNNRLYYEVNQKFKFYGPLQQIFSGGVDKSIKKGQTNEQEDDIVGDLNAVGHIELAVFTGQFTRDESAGVDILIVGEINPNALAKYVSNIEKRENKSIRYAVMDMNEFQYRLDIKDRFASSILKAKKQILIDSHSLLNKSKDNEEVKE